MRLLIALVFAAKLCATDIYVAPDGDDAGAGTAMAPLQSVQSAVDRAAAGDAIWLRSGVYRESIVVRAKRNISIAACPGEAPVLKGSQIVADWVPFQGKIWMRRDWPHDSQQLFCDGEILRQIGMPAMYQGQRTDGHLNYTPTGAGVSDLAPGSFYYQDGTLYVWLPSGDDPNAHVMEASTARRILQMDGNCSNIVLKGLRFMHSNASAHEAMGAAVELGSFCSMERCTVEWCDFAGVSLGYRQRGGRLIDCRVSDNGAVGVQGSAHGGFEIRNCVVAGNNYRRFNPIWHAGGMKFTANAFGRVMGCLVKDNQGAGIWFDFCDAPEGIAVADNIAANNLGAAGIMIEASANAVVRNNVVAQNDIRGIYVSASSRVEVRGNSIVANRGYAALEAGGVPRKGKMLSDVTLTGNALVNNKCRYDLRLAPENGRDVREIRCEGNSLNQ